MSMRKDEFEHLRVLAPKCDHRNQAPVASFGIAADLRAHKGRGGRMFEKQKQRTDKFVIQNTDNHRKDSLLGTNLFAPHPAPWNPNQSFGQLADRDVVDHMNINHNNQNADEENDTEDKRLQKLYRILKYSPPEGLPQLYPVTAPKVDLRSMPQVPAVYGRNFNRNAKGWNIGDNVDGAPYDAANPAPRLMHLSGLSTASDLSFERRQSLQSDDYNSRPRSWHSMQIEDDEILYGDYNPRPRAWQPQYSEHLSPGSQEMIPFGDYNARPKVWMSEYPGGGPGEVSYGDYNARPNPWQSKHPPNKGNPKSHVRFRVGNSRPRGWHSSREGRYMLRVISEDDVDYEDAKFGDFNALPKGWRSKGQNNHRDKTGYKDFNARPKAWQSSVDDDSSSLCSYSSEESGDYDTYYHYGRARFFPRGMAASDV